MANPKQPRVGGKFIKKGSKKRKQPASPARVVASPTTIAPPKGLSTKEKGRQRRAERAAKAAAKAAIAAVTPHKKGKKEADPAAA